MKLNKVIKGRIHYIDGKRLYVSQGHKILVSEDAEKWTYLTSFPSSYIEKGASCHQYTRRLLRAGIQHILKINKDSIIVFAYGRIQRFNLLTKKWSKAQKIVGKRPLVIAQSPSLICYGEYHSNINRNDMQIIASRDQGLTWSSIYQFKGVRHIHGISWDSKLEKFWITTGDSDQESAIWLANEEFTEISPIVSGGQQARAVELIITNKEVFYATDTPLEKNYVYKIDKKTLESTRLNAISSSVFYGAVVNNEMFFSTVCEPSLVNETKLVKLYQYKKTTQEWHNILSLDKDFLSMKYFQYGQITFPSGTNSTGKLYFTPMSCKYDGWVIEGSINE